MSKIFSVDFRKGTLIDSVSKTAGTLIAGNGGFKKTEKGLAMQFDGATTGLTYPDSDILDGMTKLSIVIWIKPIQGGYPFHHIIMKNYVNGYSFQYRNHDNAIFAYINNIPLIAPKNSIEYGKWQMFIFTYDSAGAGTGRIYKNNTLIVENTAYVGATVGANSSDLIISPTGNGLYGSVGKIQVFNTSLTQSERNELYTEFLQSQPIEKPVRGFELVKPTDLSNEVDSVIGGQLLVNSEFTTDVSGWSGADLIWQSGGYGRINKVGTYTSISQDILTIGKKYKCAYRYRTDGIASFSIGSGNGGNEYSGTLSASSSFVMGTFEFTATGTKLYLTKYSSIGVYVDIDYCTIQELTGLVAAYNMIPSNGTLVDISGNGNNGTINGAISTKDGLKFDGVDDYVEIDSGLLDLGAKSTSFRIRTTQTGAGVIVGGFYEGTYNSIFINSGAIYYGFGAGDSLKTTQTINDGLWHSITLVIDSSESGIARAKWYIDGSLDTTASATTTRVTSSTFIGARNSFGDYVNFEGELSDLRFYNYAFTPQQAKEYHNSFIKPVILEDWSGSAVGDVI